MHYFQLALVRAEQMNIKARIKRWGQIERIIQHFHIRALLKGPGKSQIVTA